MKYIELGEVPRIVCVYNTGTIIPDFIKIIGNYKKDTSESN